MTTVADFWRSPATRFAALALAAVVTLGAAFEGRSPTDTMRPLPEMADHPVIQPDGSALFVQRYEVTIAEWNACFDDGACAITLRARSGDDPATTPATGLNHDDARDYLRWINAATGHSFRLPTVAEWTGMAQAVLPDDPDPLFTDPALRWASAYLIDGLGSRALRPQGRTQDCYAGEADGIDPARCPAYFVGGAHVSAMFFMERDPAQGGCAVGTPPAHLGMRMVSDQPVR